MSQGESGGIAFFSHSANVAGAERALVAAVQLARDAGREVAVYLPEHGPLARELEALDVPWEPYELIRQCNPAPAMCDAVYAWKRIWPGLAGRVASVTESLRRRRIRLVYVNTIYPVEGVLAAAQLGLPVVWHPHELFHEDFHDWLLGTPLFALFLGALSDVVIAVSGPCMESIRPWVPAEKLVLIHEPVDWESLQAPRPVPEDLRAEWERASFVLACVGSIDLRKAQGDLLDALTRMPAELASRTLTWIVGTPSTEELGQAFFAHLGRLPPHVRVRVLGQREDVPAILQAADVLVHPSINDPFPLAVLEALASGTPVVAARGGGVIESVQDGVTGRLVPCGDPSALAAALTDVLRDPERLRAMGEAGRSAVRAYDLSIYREKIKTALERGLAAKVDGASRRKMVEMFETRVGILGRIAAEVDGLDQPRAWAAEIERLKATRSFRIGEAVSNARGLGDFLRLPVRLAHIAFEKRAP